MTGTVKINAKAFAPADIEEPDGDGVWSVDCVIETKDGTRTGVEQVSGSGKMTDAALEAALLALYPEAEE